MMLPGRKQQQGFALIIVLFGLALLAGALAVLSQRGVAESYGTGNVLLRARQVQAADAGLAIGLRAMLAEAPPPAEVIFEDMQLGLRIMDAARLVDINTAPPERLRDLLRELQLDGAEANALLAVLADWIDADDRPRLQGAEAMAYRAAGLSYGPRNAPLESLAELPLLLGFPPELYPRLLPFLTVHGALAGAVQVIDVVVQTPGAGFYRRRSLVLLEPDGRQAWRLLAQYELPN